MQCVRSRRCYGRYGLRGTRAGEAAHPGPPVASVSEPGSTVPASIQAFHVVQRGAPAVDMSRDDSDRETGPDVKQIRGFERRC